MCNFQETDATLFASTTFILHQQYFDSSFTGCSSGFADQSGWLKSLHIPRDFKFDENVHEEFSHLSANVR